MVSVNFGVIPVDWDSRGKLIMINCRDSVSVAEGPDVTKATGQWEKAQESTCGQSQQITGWFGL